MWPALTNPPVVVALFQIKIEAPNDKTTLLSKCNREFFKDDFPVCSNNIQVGLDIGNSKIPLGESKIHTKYNATLGSILYSTKDQRTKLEISDNSLTYIDENEYLGWGSFKKNVVNVLLKMDTFIFDYKIVRTSIRFINRFLLPDFDNPSDYFNTQISTSASTDQINSYPIRQYGFKLQVDVPNTDTYALINHTVESVGQEFLYTFDIDVLDRSDIVYNIDTIDSKMEHLREVKNNIFFGTITEKTQALCNSKK